MSIQWIPELQPHEFPDGVLENMDDKVINALIKVRTASGVPVTPSPIPEAHIRIQGTSRHSIQNYTRKSDATDFFVKSNFSSVQKTILAIQSVPEIKGWGVYFDTKPSVMFHIDTRKDPLRWVRVNKNYIYESLEILEYYKTLYEQLKNLGV